MTTRLVGIFPLFAACVWGQFFGLATPGDGSRLYFATRLRQKNSTQPDYGKLFRIDASGLSLQKSIPYEAPPATGPFTPSLSNPYDLQSADVSSDGQVFAAVTRHDCMNYPDAGCFKMSNLVTTITAGGTSRDYGDSVRLSANGKWAFGGTGTPLYSNVFGYLVNVTTDEQTVLGPGTLAITRFQVSGNGRPIANNGTAVFSDIASLVILQGSQVRRIPLPHHYLPSDAVIDAAAQTIVYAETAAIESNGGISLTLDTSLRVADLASGQTATLASDGYAPSLSDDGGSVVYLSKRDGLVQAWLIHTDGSGDRKLTHDPLGVQRALLSGDGSTVYAVTLGGQLLKIATGSGAIQELIPRTPYVDAGQITAPGTLTTLTGEGLADFALSAAAPLPYTLENTSVTIQGIPIRILSVGPTEITVLTPPGVTPNQTASAQLDVASPSPFAGPAVALRVFNDNPQFLELTPLYVLAAHEDWSGLVTADNPAHPGEAVHAYAAGLGDTSPAVAYGAPAPSQEPLARVVTPYRCFAGQQPQEVAVFFEGLAPNLAGIYQIDWRVPTGAPAGDLGMICQMGATIGGFPSFSGRLPVQP
jgi:uncharacterized protein (TIGR03437 family)